MTTLCIVIFFVLIGVIVYAFTMAEHLEAIHCTKYDTKPEVK